MSKQKSSQKPPQTPAEKKPADLLPPVNPFAELSASPGPTALTPTAEDSEAKNADHPPPSPPTPHPKGEKGEKDDEMPIELEIAAMERRLAELKAKAGASQPASSSQVEPAPNFEVSVPDAPTLQVYAVDHANAWEAYRRQTGMISTIHQPRISPIQAA